MKLYARKRIERYAPEIHFICANKAEAKNAMRKKCDGCCNVVVKS